MVIMCQEKQSHKFTFKSVSQEYIIGVILGLACGVISVFHMTVVKFFRSPEIPDSWQLISYMTGGLLPSLLELISGNIWFSCHFWTQAYGMLAAVTQVLGSWALIKGKLSLHCLVVFNKCLLKNSLKVFAPTRFSGGGTICSSGFFVQTMFADRYIYPIEL